MGGEEAAMAPIVAAADEEGLDRHHPALAGQGEYVGIPEPFRMDGLAALDEGQGAEPVAIDGGKLEIEIPRRLLHQPSQLLLNLGRLAGEEILRVRDQLAIGRLVDSPDARRRAA